MRFDLIFSGLKILVEAFAARGEIYVSELTDVAVMGEEQSQLVAASESQAKISVRWLRSRSNGGGERRQVWDEISKKFKNTNFANRVLTFEISGKSYDQADDGMIFPLLENVKARLETPTGLAEIRKLQCTLASTDDIQASPNLGYNEDGVVSEATFLLELNVGIFYEDLPDISIEIINTTFQVPS